MKIRKRREQLTQNLDTLAHRDIPVSRPVERTPADELKDQLNPGLKLGFEERDNVFLARREQMFELPGMSLVTDVFDQSQHSSLMLPHGLVNHAAVAILLNWLLDGELVSLADIPEVIHNAECPLTEVPRQADWAHAGCGCAGVRHGWRKEWKTKLAQETIRACCPLEKPADAVLVFLRSQVAPRHDNSEHERLVDLDDDGLFADGLVPTENPAEAAAYPLVYSTTLATVLDGGSSGGPQISEYEAVYFFFSSRISEAGLEGNGAVAGADLGTVDQDYVAFCRIPPKYEAAAGSRALTEPQLQMRGVKMCWIAARLVIAIWLLIAGHTPLR